MKLTILSALFISGAFSAAINDCAETDLRASLISKNELGYLELHSSGSDYVGDKMRTLVLTSDEIWVQGFIDLHWWSWKYATFCLQKRNNPNVY
ncbi:uncharacterized protein RAG0_10866 [Rhynchosporium agropyri]|uniref:Uncharacterized protein n=1 Tax=Rhynchosporium agropyri TaxID=914238 RepID=A0A1E1L1J8_9HELO|nr:uncharacterized protein RAG0_10866 [Rhynchosporium agropyri]